jgi:photosystem II stability/assembly factor-like uncharacterized protein
MGMQDNGEGKITPQGRQVEVFGGDGVFTQVDPKDSQVAYEELPDAGVNVTTDGGQSWTDVDPLVDNPSFYAPLVMDPRDPKHLLTGGREIVETTSGPDTTSPGVPPLDTDWKTVEDLGHTHGRENQVSAIAVRGSAVYAGYCGGCDTVLNQKRFFSGLATNVGGSKPPKPGTHHGWHKIAAKGLPHRFISSIAIAPHNARTIYVTLGASDLRPYASPHAEGRHTGISARGGHVYVSTNAGRSFRNVSANLEHTAALWAMVRGRKLLVATPYGVFTSTAPLTAAEARWTRGRRHARRRRDRSPRACCREATRPRRRRRGTRVTRRRPVASPTSSRRRGTAPAARGRRFGRRRRWGPPAWRVGAGARSSRSTAPRRRSRP